jgi:hypothetical protein
MHNETVTLHKMRQIKTDKEKHAQKEEMLPCMCPPSIKTCHKVVGAKQQVAATKRLQSTTPAVERESTKGKAQVALLLACRALQNQRWMIREASMIASGQPQGAVCSSTGAFA